ncbi:MAG: ABC transporter ATP-binding protein [Rhizobiaceae bacterium]|nr:ABC transporter ATP-binding protein [Rhizobiaceae bacterium]
MTAQDYLTVTAVDKSFGGLKALRDCSFSISKGAITCLVGPNGAGKTSIFNVITGFIKPDQGAIEFEGRSLVGSSPQHIVSLGIARTFQHLRLFNDMSVLDNVLISMRGQFGEMLLTGLFRPFRTQRGLSEKTAAARAILQDVGLGPKSAEIVRNLSYGEQKLLCIARVLASGADLILLDEPASGLSAAELQATINLLHRLRDSGKTLLIVEHNTRVVKQIASDVLFLHQGHLMARGTPDEITRDPALAEIYFGNMK